MLRNVIRAFVTMLGHRTLDDMIDRDRDREIELPLRRIRKPAQVQVLEGPMKGPNTFDF